MKIIFKILFFMGMFTSLFGQTNSEMVANIEGLLNKEMQQDAISFLFKINSDDPSILKQYNVILSENLNRAIQSSEFDFSMINLALELSESEAFEINQETEKVLSIKNKTKRLKLKQEDHYHAWIWNDESYMDDRADCALILDLLGYGKSEFSLNELKESLAYLSDNRPKYFTVASLIQRGEEIDAKHLHSIAKDDETRGMMFRYLQSIDKLSLFPEEFNTQEDLSRADMVNWLIYPTELTRVPTKIELVKVFTIEYSDVGPADFYLWKFMADDETWKEEGWMTGLSGPFVKSEVPTMESYGYTFSAFSKFKNKTPEEHFEEIMGIIDEWNNQNEE
jgi:hypothetical protein